jgi:hypothetical protein
VLGALIREGAVRFLGCAGAGDVVAAMTMTRFYSQQSIRT